MSKYESYRIPTVKSPFSGKSFVYKGLKFTPYKRFELEDNDFVTVSQHLGHSKYTPTDWSWDDFYKKSTDKKCDLFLLGDEVVIPCTNYLFEYKEHI